METIPNRAEYPATLERHAWEWCRHENNEELSRAVADRLATALRRRPDSLVCLAAGASTRRAYEIVATQAVAEPSTYARARWIKLDEWGGLAKDDPASCEYFLRRVLLGPLDVPPERYCSWEGQAADPGSECRRVSAWLAAHGPIDLQILGLGKNGHLGFNEPGEVLLAGPHVEQLSATSLSHAMLVQRRSSVTFGLTLGMGDILRSRRIFLLVSGENKARQLRRLAMGAVSPEFPASLLHQHPAVTIFCDAAAASQFPTEFPANSHSSHRAAPPAL